MFQSIPWAQYWLAIGIAAIIYYGLLVLRYASAHGWRWLKTDKESAAIRLATFYHQGPMAQSCAGRGRIPQSCARRGNARRIRVRQGRTRQGSSTPPPIHLTR